ncbi:hypothetical protein [Paenibacillus harenae]|uniref:hypothetical protein n=1 Tax=Paenibacillus harenae TaxID=306543 RepID=UPI0027943B3A|nr:hypothetical protein [Paenibacillus harenae]MDQ0059026.1 hypothetical protein [Paenibacillus harenae]
MESIDIFIGEHVLRISSASSAVMSLFSRTFPTVIRCGSFDFEPAIAVHLDEGYGSPFVDYNVGKQQTDTGTVRYARTDYIIETDEDCKQVAIKFHDELALKHAFMHLYSLYIVRSGWGLLIHSSCVTDNCGGHMFTGRSGAGKSTAAALSESESRGIIADEATILRIRPDEVTVFHSPFRSEIQTAAPLEPGQWRLSSIHLLHQAEQHRRMPIARSEGLIRLMDKVFFWNPSTDDTKAIIGLLRQTVHLVPLYDLYFRKDPYFWELISS